MTDSSERPQFLPPEEPPTFLPPEDPAPPAAPVAEHPAPPTPRPGRRLPAVAGAAALVLVVGMIAWLAWPSGKETPPRQPRFTALPDLCTAASAAVAKHAPRAERPKPDASIKDGVTYSACAWREPQSGRPGQKTLTTSEITVAVRLHPDPADGVRSARAEYDAAWRTASASAGTTKDRISQSRGEAPEALGGLGDQAFLQHQETSMTLGSVGSVKVTIRLRNAVLTVEHMGAVSPLDKLGIPQLRKSKPIDEAKARTSAEETAQTITNALITCPNCLTR